MHAVALVVYPELRHVPDEERTRALRDARRAPLDVVELLGIAASLIVAMLVVRYGLPAGEVPLALRGMALAAAGAVTIGPFLVRRTRRALRDREK